MSKKETTECKNLLITGKIFTTEENYLPNIEVVDD
jgi:hypothetical protein